MAGATTEIRFEGRVEKIGDRFLLRLPASASADLPSRGQVAAKGTINEHPIEIVIEPDGRRGHWIPLDDSLSLGEGDTASLTLRSAEAWPEPQVPADLQDALSEAPDLADTWSDITPMARWEWVRWVNATKNPQTRERRLEVSISKLRDGKRRPCCFDLSSCTDPDLARSGKLREPS